MGKIPIGITISHICAKDYNHMMYGSRDMVRDGRTDGRTEKVTIEVGVPTKNTSGSLMF